MINECNISGVQKIFFRDLRAHKSETTRWNIFKLDTFGSFNVFREHVKFRYSNLSSFKDNVQDVTQVRFRKAKFLYICLAGFDRPRNQYQLRY